MYGNIVFGDWPGSGPVKLEGGLSVLKMLRLCIFASVCAIAFAEITSYITLLRRLEYYDLL